MPVNAAETAELAALAKSFTSSFDARGRLESALREHLVVTSRDSFWMCDDGVDDVLGPVVIYRLTRDVFVDGGVAKGLPSSSDDCYRATYSVGDDGFEFGEPVRVKRVTSYQPEDLEPASDEAELPPWLGQVLALSAGMTKAAGHRYIRRVPKAGGGYRYFYKVSGGKGLGHEDEMTVGAKFRVTNGGKDGHFEIVGKDDKGNLRIKHDESGHESVVSPAALRSMLHAEHAQSLTAHREKLAVDIKAADDPKAKARLLAEAGKYEHTRDLAGGTVPVDRKQYLIDSFRRQGEDHSRISQSGPDATQRALYAESGRLHTHAADLMAQHKEGAAWPDHVQDAMTAARKAHEKAYKHVPAATPAATPAAPAKPATARSGGSFHEQAADDPKAKARLLAEAGKYEHTRDLGLGEELHAGMTEDAAKESVKFYARKGVKAVATPSPDGNPRKWKVYEVGTPESAAPAKPENTRDLAAPAKPQGGEKAAPAAPDAPVERRAGETWDDVAKRHQDIAATHKANGDLRAWVSELDKANAPKAAAAHLDKVASNTHVLQHIADNGLKPNGMNKHTLSVVQAMAKERFYGSGQSQPQAPGMAASEPAQAGYHDLASAHDSAAMVHGEASKAHFRGRDDAADQSATAESLSKKAAEKETTEKVADPSHAKSHMDAAKRNAEMASTHEREAAAWGKHAKQTKASERAARSQYQANADSHAQLAKWHRTAATEHEEASKYKDVTNGNYQMHADTAEHLESRADRVREGRSAPPFSPPARKSMSTVTDPERDLAKSLQAAHISAAEAQPDAGASAAHREAAGIYEATANDAASTREFNAGMAQAGRVAGLVKAWSNIPDQQRPAFATFRKSMESPVAVRPFAFSGSNSTGDALGHLPAVVAGSQPQAEVTTPASPEPTTYSAQRGAVNGMRKSMGAFYGKLAAGAAQARLDVRFPAEAAPPAGGR